MIEIEIEKALVITHGTWVSYTLKMGCRSRFKAKSGIPMFRITLDTVDWPNTRIHCTLKWLIKVRGQERYARVQYDITCTLVAQFSLFLI